MARIGNRYMICLQIEFSIGLVRAFGGFDPSNDVKPHSVPNPVCSCEETAGLQQTFHTLEESRLHPLGSQRDKVWGLWVAEYFTPEPHGRWRGKLGMLLVLLALCSFWVIVGYGVSIWL
jgi:hypothetical protein